MIGLSVSSMVPLKHRRGELPSGRQAYGEHFRLLWPVVAEYLLQALGTTLDLMMVGTLGSVAIAAVGVTNQPRLIFLCMTRALAVGITIVVARRFGEGDPDGANALFKQGLVLCVILSLAMMALGYASMDGIFRFLGADDDVRLLANQYFRIVLLGNFLASVTMVISGALRGVGQTRITMVANTAANAVKLVVNFLLIGGRFGLPALGVRGAALGTVIGFGFALFLCLRVVWKNHGFLSLRWPGSWRLTKEKVRALAGVSAGTLVEYLGIRAGMFVFVKVIAGLGTVVFAAYQVVNNVIEITFMVGEGLGVAAAALVGREMGRGRPDLSMMHARIGVRFGVIAAAVIAPVMLFWNRPLMLLFTKDMTVVDAGGPQIAFLSAAVIWMIASGTLSGALRGAGDVAFVGVSSSICFMLLRPGLAYVLCYPAGLGLFGALTGLFMDYIIRSVLYYLRFRRGGWMDIRV